MLLKDTELLLKRSAQKSASAELGGGAEKIRAEMVSQESHGPAILYDGNFRMLCRLSSLTHHFCAMILIKQTEM